MRRTLVCLTLLFGFAAGGFAQQKPSPDKRPPGPARKGAYAVDAGGRSIRALENGSTLFVGARGLRPNTTYEFRLGIGRESLPSLEGAVSFARVTTDRRGGVPPFVLWYESGVAGCSDQMSERRKAPPNTYRTFEEAEEALHGKTLLVSAHAVEKSESGRVPPMKLRVDREPESSFRLPILPRRSPEVYASDKDGCMLNSQLAQRGDLYVSGQHFRPGESLQISVVPNQRLWYVGDAINDVTGVDFAAASERVTVGPDGRFTVKAWDAINQRRGAYDIVAHRPVPAAPASRIGRRDIISYAAETGFILYLRYPVGGPTMDIAGRPFSWSPYFEFADSFADTGDPVWGAVDPTYIPMNHPGGTYAAYYVVNHRDVAGWDPQMGGATNLVDVSGGFEIHAVKSWCVNGTDVIIWPSPLNPGSYDVVVDFGQNPAATPQQYATDGNYDAAVDFLDGADQIGFVVATDPYALGNVPIGQDSYSQDDFFPMLGGAANVDLRAVVRYPATAPGQGMPVAAGQHPIFVIEHGNHFLCAVGKDGRTTAQEYADARAGIVTWAQFSAWQYDHVTCPNRTKNHEGYMHLLDALASHGIIAVSIDAYDLTGPVPGWIVERGTLILKHLELWSHMNNPQTFMTYPDFFNGRFANHVDLTKISVSGHSRGGEASVAAYMLNNFFTIGSVSSIAPVDFTGYVLPDVPYFVIIPAADGDVFSLNGVPIYDRAGSGLQPPDATLKSGIDVYGASHNFFNTVWAADFDDNTDPNRPDYIPAAEQQKIGEAYLAAFARIHLNNEVVYMDMMRGKLTFPSTAGRKIYPFHHEKLHSKLENGTNMGALAAGGAAVMSVNNPSVHQTAALRVGWPTGTATLTYTIPMNMRDVSGFEVLSFRVAQTNSMTNPVMGDQDFEVELQGGGKTKTTFAFNYGHIPRPYDSRGQNVMTTIRIPLHSFIMNNSGVTLNNVDTLVFRFLLPTQGEIYVDDIEFSR
ncbi:MAG TPA: hypothetical protein VGR03_04240 [Candidatus Acidoferrum sp.]|nr:hypothetical protein [Candidatus Acidoferrum sp.]